MKKVQAELGGEKVEFSSGGGMVKAVATCDLSLKEISIKPEAVDPEDVEMLEDLVLTAVEGVLKAARDKAAEKMSAVTAGLGLPGINLPGM